MQTQFFKKLTRGFLASVFAVALASSMIVPALYAAPLSIDELGLKETGVATGLTDVDVRVYIGRGIQVALSMIGVVFLVLIIYAGFQWMLSQGNTGKVTEARNTILQGVIGLGVVMGAYALTSFVIGQLIK